MRTFTFLFFLLSFQFIAAQQTILKGNVADSAGPLPGCSVIIPSLGLTTSCDADGNYEFKALAFGTYEVVYSAMGMKTQRKKVVMKADETTIANVTLEDDNLAIEEVVVTGTMKEMSRTDSPIPVEIVTAKLFKKNPTATLFEAVGMVNGVQPQLNCSVCNTGDIHINGMEGPYTMILIDGMPIVSALSTVYGLNGIPNSIVDRIEVVKGPGSSLYGSEAMGGIINVITKSPLKAPVVSADVFTTSWGDVNMDAAVRLKAGKATGLLGINYFIFKEKHDHNRDNFTDVTLQDRFSIFNKWSFERKDNRIASIAGRYVYEDRWGGELQWNKSYRGSNQVYGESIYTRRAELIGLYQLPVSEKIFTQYSYNWHDQNSWYGTTPYMANQQVAFIQTYWDKQLGENHNFLLGAALRYTSYDDNTPATAGTDGSNNPSRKALPGLFVQDEWSINEKHKLLGGYRYDHDSDHGSVHSPRIAYKFSPNANNVVRASFGTGFRVVNLFTEDHAALTGAREVVITEALKPERSYNGNLNYVLKIPTESVMLGFDITGFYSYFTNKIVGDFDADPNKIIYDNLRGHAISQGISLNTDITFTFPLKILAGISYMNVYQMEDRGSGNLERVVQLHAPKWSGTFVASYSLPYNLSADLTGNFYGPMRLPVLPNDYRPEYSPWFCIANLQLTKKFDYGLEFYGGVKNLFDFVPKNPIIRPFDPFDRTADDPVTNPNGYTFDPSYNYASMQGRRLFLGVRYNLL